MIPNASLLIYNRAGVVVVVNNPVFQSQGCGVDMYQEGGRVVQISHGKVA